MRIGKGSAAITTPCEIQPTYSARRRRQRTISSMSSISRRTGLPLWLPI